MKPNYGAKIMGFCAIYRSGCYAKKAFHTAPRQSTDNASMHTGIALPAPEKCSRLALNSRQPVCAKPSAWAQTTYRVVSKITTGMVISASMVDTATLAVTSSWATS